MSATGGTFRGTPSRGQGRGQVPVFESSPSNIPRPKLESHASSAMQSDAGTSTLSASRQKQTKRDEVSILFHGCKDYLTVATGHPKEDGG